MFYKIVDFSMQIYVLQNSKMSLHLLPVTNLASA